MHDIDTPIEGALLTIPTPDPSTFIGSRQTAILRVMEANGTAEVVDSEWQTSITNLLSLEEEQIDILGWPPLFPGKLSIEDKGTFNSRDFRYKIRVFGQDNIELTNASIEKGKIIVGKIEYRLTLQQYQMVCAVEETNSSPPSGELSKTDVIAHNLKRFKLIKKLAIAAGTELSAFFTAEQVEEPNTIIPILAPREDGSSDLVPIPAYRPSGNPDEQAKPVIPPDAVNGFSQRSYARPDLPYHGTRSSGNPIRVITDKPLQSGIKEMKQLGRLNPDESRLFLKNPSLFIESPVFDLEQYSTRVVDLGSLLFRTNPPAGGGGMSQDWDSLLISIEPDSGALPARLIRITTIDEINELRTAWQEAKSCDANKLEYSGQVYERDDGFIDWLLKTKELELTDIEVIQPEDERVEDSEPKHLLIATNLDSAEFEDGVTPPGVDSPLKPNALLPKIKLFPHQLYGLAWLQSIHRSQTGGILADDMGLGKTLQVLSYVVQAIEAGAKGPFLVIAPLSVVDVWRDELQARFGPEIQSRLLVLDKDFFHNPHHRVSSTIVRMRGGEEITVRCNALSEQGLTQIRKAGIVICHYEAVRSYQISLGSVDFEAIICDEAQRIKNPTTLVTNAVKAMNARSRIICTATPVENSLTDLWCLTDFARPGLLGSQKAFESKYAAKPGEIIPEVHLDTLRQKIDDERLLLRRTKEKNLPDLPDKKEKVELLTLSQRQISLYGHYVRTAAEEPRRTLGVLIRLLMLSDHPALLSGSDPTSRTIDELLEESPKLGQTINWLSAIQEKGEKALIFTRLKRMQMILQLVIDGKFGYGSIAGILNGDTPVKARKAKVESFQENSGFSVLILSPDVAGMGLNIVAANHVIHYTRLWNPAKESQATDRVYRIGQTKDVYVYYPITKSPDDSWITVEQRLHELLRWKRSLMKHVITPTSAMNVSKDELQEVLQVSGLPVIEPVNLDSLDLRDGQMLRALIQFLLGKDGQTSVPGNRLGLSTIDLVVDNDAASTSQWIIINPENKEVEDGVLEERLQRDFEAARRKPDELVFIVLQDSPLFEKIHGVEVNMITRADLEQWIARLQIDQEELFNEIHPTDTDDFEDDWMDVLPDHEKQAK